MTSAPITRLYTSVRDVCMNFRVSHTGRYCYLPIFTLVCDDITSRYLLCNIKEKLLKLYKNIVHILCVGIYITYQIPQQEQKILRNKNIRLKKE